MWVLAPAGCTTETVRAPVAVSDSGVDSASATANDAREPAPRPYGPRGVGHPLAGSLWDVEARREVSIDEFARIAGRTVFILLGEQHDNAEHHALQAQVIESLAHDGRHPVVAFEMFDVDSQARIDSCFGDGVCSAAELRDTVAWDDSGWPAWEIYEPVFSSALENGLSVVAANLPKDKARTLAADPNSEQSRAIIEDLGIREPVSLALREKMGAEIRDAHCGHASEAMIDGMIAAQRARDAQMAERLYLIRNVHRGTQIVLVAGFGHTRKDRGVPIYLERLDRFTPVLSVAFVEVDDGWSDFADVAEAFDGVVPFDFVGFTARTDDEDPCEVFRAQLEGMAE